MALDVDARAHPAGCACYRRNGKAGDEQGDTDGIVPVRVIVAAGSAIVHMQQHAVLSDVLRVLIGPDTGNGLELF